MTDLVLIECRGVGCERWFAICARDLRGQRYCGVPCRTAARKASCDAARKLYTESIRRDPCLLRADRAKRAQREKARRARARLSKPDPRVPEHSTRAPHTSGIINTDVGTGPPHAAGWRCHVCGAPGRVRRTLRSYK